MAEIIVCKGCNKPIGGNEDYVQPVENASFHPDHFVCMGPCKQSLLTQGYLTHEDKFYCQADYAKIMEKQTGVKATCGYCNNLINGQYIEAIGGLWHPDHFICMVCALPYDKETFHQHQGKPYCEKHYQELFATKCSRCRRGILGHIIEALGKEFHLECFVCEVGSHPIGEGTYFFMHEGKIMCRPHYDELVLHPCSECNMKIKGQYVKALGETFHQQCWDRKQAELGEGDDSGSEEDSDDDEKQTPVIEKGNTNIPTPLPAIVFDEPLSPQKIDVSEEKKKDPPSNMPQPLPSPKIASRPVSTPSQSGPSSQPQSTTPKSPSTTPSSPTLPGSSSFNNSSTPRGYALSPTVAASPFRKMVNENLNALPPSSRPTPSAAPFTKSQSFQQGGPRASGSSGPPYVGSDGGGIKPGVPSSPGPSTKPGIPQSPAKTTTTITDTKKPAPTSSPKPTPQSRTSSSSTSSPTTRFTSFTSKYLQDGKKKKPPPKKSDDDDNGITLQEAMSTPQYCEILHTFMENNLCLENLTFLQNIHQYRLIDDEEKRGKACHSIYLSYVAKDAPQMINLDSQNFSLVKKKMDSKNFTRDLFDSAYKVVYDMTSRDVFRRFLNSEEYNLMVNDPLAMSQAYHKKGKRRCSFSILRLEEDYPYLDKLTLEIKASGICKPSRVLLKKFDLCLTGQDLVDWMIVGGKAKTRLLGVSIAQRMVEAGLLTKISGDGNNQMFRYSKDTYNLREMLEIKKSWPEYPTLLRQPGLTTGVLLFKGVRYHRTWAILSKQDKILYLYRSENGDSPHSRVNVKGCTALVHVAVKDKDGKSKKPSGPRPVPVATKATSARPVSNSSIPSTGVRSRDRASAIFKGKNLLGGGDSNPQPPAKKVWPPPSSTAPKKPDSPSPTTTTSPSTPTRTSQSTPSSTPRSVSQDSGKPSSGGGGGGEEKEPGEEEEEDTACYLQITQSGERTMVFLIEDSKDRDRWISALQDIPVAVEKQEWPVV